MENKEPLKVVKIGGNIIEDSLKLRTALEYFSKMKGYKILIHGGGKEASQLANKLNVPVQMEQGRRITNAATLEIITMVYAGKVNKGIVASLQGMGCNSLGLSGADANIILSERRSVKAVDYGYVGDVKNINSHIIELLLQSNITPVFCAISHNGKGQLLNTNADTIASEIAIAMNLRKYLTHLYYCFDKKGVMRDLSNDKSVIPSINHTTYKELSKQGVISEGMLPKLENSFYALNHKVSKVLIGDINMLSDNNDGLHTTLTL